MKDGEVGFMYFDVIGTKPRPGVVTVAYKKGMIGELMVGVAFCSPKEKHFSKEGGRSLATIRLNVVLQFIHKEMFTPAIIRPIVLASIYKEAKVHNISWMQKKGIRIEHRTSRMRAAVLGRLYGRHPKKPTAYELMGPPKIQQGGR